MNGESSGNKPTPADHLRTTSQGELVERVRDRLEREMGTHCERCEHHLPDLGYAARAAIAEVFDALMEPQSSEVLIAGSEAADIPDGDAFAVWQAMLSQARKEAGV